MESYLKELTFRSHEPTYIRDITGVVNSVIEETRTKTGLVIVTSFNTTLGFMLNETGEEGLCKDMVETSKWIIPEDPRSTWAAGKKYIYPTIQYRHECAASPLKPPEEIDEDYNAGRHLRALLFGAPQVVRPYTDGKLALGRYQGLAVWEFDGRDGTGINPERKRRINIEVFPGIQHILPAETIEI